MGAEKKFIFDRRHRGVRVVHIRWADVIRDPNSGFSKKPMAQISIGPNRLDGEHLSRN